MNCNKIGGGYKTSQNKTEEKCQCGKIELKESYQKGVSRNVEGLKTYIKFINYIKGFCVHLIMVRTEKRYCLTRL